MRILWVGHNLAYPPVRGVLLRNYNLLREAAKECEVHVLAFDQPATRPLGVSAEDCVNALRKFCAHVEFVPLTMGILKTYPYWLGLRGLFSGLPYDIHWLASRAMADRLQKTLEQVSFDAIHFDTLGLAQYRALVSGIGTILNHHNVESSMMAQRAESEIQPMRRRYWRWEAQKLRSAEQHYCPQFDINIVVSSEDEESLKNIAPSIKTRIVPNGVDTEYFTPRPDPGSKNLLFCGGLDWYPNGDAMVYFFESIWPKLMHFLPDVHICVVGRKPPKWLQQLGNSDHRVQVTGFVDDVRPYFRNATVYICPIRIGGGTRLKILDALAMGMPLVSTTFACSGLFIQREKHALLADTADEFVNQIQRILSDPILRENLALQGRELVCREYSWSVIGNNLIQAYKDASLSAVHESAYNLSRG